MTRTGSSRGPRRRALVLAAALVALAAPGVDAAKRASVPCTAVAVSPAFASDRTVFCAAGAGADRKHIGPVYFYTSTDAGRTWSSGVRVANEPMADGALLVLPSPAYETDRSVFVETRWGGFVSRDAGRTFQQLVGGSGDGGFGRGLPTAFVEAVPFETPFAQRPALVSALDGDGCCDAVFDPQVFMPRYLPPAAPFRTRRYLLPPDFARSREAVAVRNPGFVAFRPEGSIFDDGATYDDDARVLACDGDLACGRVLYEFPRTPGSDGSVVSYVGPTFTGGTDMYAVVYDEPFANWGYRVYRSRDAGRTWQKWASATRAVRGYWWGSQVHITASPTAPGRLWLRVSRAAAALERGVVSQELFRSDDGGGTWRRVGRSWSPGTGGGTLPWNDYDGSEHPIVAAPGGHLYLIGEHRSGRKADYLGLYCSHDLGRTWLKGC